jgi:hypothetical protein
MSIRPSLSNNVVQVRLHVGVRLSLGRMVVYLTPMARFAWAPRSYLASIRMSYHQSIQCELMDRAFYYSEKQQFIGLAGKPNSVNDFNALSKERSGPNGKLAGIRKSSSPTRVPRTKLMRSNRIPPRGPHPPPDSMLLPKQKLVPISLVPWNPSSTSSTSERPRTRSDHPTAHGRCRWGGDGSSPNDGSSSNGYDAREDGGARLYACSYGSWTCFVWWTDDGWTVWITRVGTTATNVSGAYATSTS